MLANPEYGGNSDKIGWKLIGFDDRFSWGAPFGWYDRDVADHVHPSARAAAADDGRATGPTTKSTSSIVGSGAAGGVVAKELSTAGFRVVVLEQGPWRTEKDFVHDEMKIFNQNLLHERLGQVSRTRFARRAQEKAKVKPSVLYGRGVGGTSVHFSANFWRFREIDFKEASVKGTLAGTGFADWPITYQDLEPYYTKVDWEVGVAGRAGPVRSAALAALSDAAASAEIHGRAARARREEARLQAVPGADGDRVEAATTVGRRAFSAASAWASAARCARNRARS